MTAIGTNLTTIDVRSSVANGSKPDMAPTAPFRSRLPPKRGQAPAKLTMPVLRYMEACVGASSSHDGLT